MELIPIYELDYPAMPSMSELNLAVPNRSKCDHGRIISVTRRTSYIQLRILNGFGYSIWKLQSHDKSMLSPNSKMP